MLYPIVRPIDKDTLIKRRIVLVKIDPKLTATVAGGRRTV